MRNIRLTTANEIYLIRNSLRTTVMCQFTGPLKLRMTIKVYVDSHTLHTLLLNAIKNGID